MKTFNEKNNRLELLILKALEEHFSCADEIVQKLKRNKIEFTEREFYPVLSGLQINNLLCCNWLENEDGLPVKHYHLTRTGLHYIHKS